MPFGLFHCINSYLLIGDHVQFTALILQFPPGKGWSALKHLAQVTFVDAIGASVMKHPAQGFSDGWACGTDLVQATGQFNW